eukprot:13170628-Ditylum_brightwellii.AAC.2
MKERNVYLEKYGGFRVGSLNKDMLDFEIDGVPQHEKLLDDINIIDIKPTVFAKTKGIHTIDSTKEM